MAGEQVALCSTVSMGEEVAGERVEGANRGGTKALSEPWGSNYQGRVVEAGLYRVLVTCSSAWSVPSSYASS